MADDPTVRMAPRQLRECPTCGKKPLPEEIVCSLCGTNLQQAVPEPTVVILPSSLPPPAPLSPPAPMPPQKGSLTATRPVRPSEQPQTILSFKWIGLAGGVVALILLSFFAGMLSVQLGGESKLPEARGTKDEVSQHSPVTPPVRGPQEPSPPLQPAGQVTTADELMPIHVFGTGTNDAARTVPAFRNQAQRLLANIQNLYNEKLATHPQLSGAVVLELKVTPEGWVSGAEVHTTAIDDTEFLQRIAHIVKDWKFEPAQAGEVKVFYPLLLTPQTIGPPTLTSYVKEVWPGRYKVLAPQSVSVRSQPDSNAKEAGAIGSGLRVYIISSRGGWLGILSPKGEVGYIRREAIFPRVEDPVPLESKG